MLPILVDIPLPIVTDRLMIREPRLGEGRAVNDAIAESFAELSPWLPWCKTMPSVEDSETFTRESVAKFVERRDIPLRLWSRDGTRLIGSSGLHPQAGEPLKFEIGYWIRTSEAGHGVMTEAVRAIAAFGFDRLEAKRIFIRCDRDNIASRRVAEKAGFTLEGTFRHDFVRNDGTLGTMCYYARVE
jgi:RimJ/RimL family protein N-acetyltransferase